MNSSAISNRPAHQRRMTRGVRIGGELILLMAGFVLTGCQEPQGYSSTSDPGFAPTPPSAAATGGTFSAGDTIKVTFAVETNNNTVAKIQLDGLVPLPLVGDVPAAGMTALALQTNLTERYKRFLKGDEVTVSLAASSASVYVTGSVLRPGRIVMDRPLTALEAIMEAGGFDIRAGTSSVKVSRLEGGRRQTYTIDLRSALNGREPIPFWLKPFDIINVPDKKFNF